MQKTKRGIVFGVFLVSLILAVSVVVVAKPNVPNSVVPAHAVQVSEGVFSLGQAKDPASGKIVQGFMFIHDDRNSKKGHAKPPWAGGGNGKGESKCYSLFAKGARWKTTEPYTTSSDVDLALTETSLNTWDSEVSFNIFGTGSVGTTNVVGSGGSLDGKNEVMFENLGAEGPIAFSVVWGIFSGPPFTRELVEWDAVFNTAYTFGDAGPTDENNLGDTSVMDYQNIATHEFGHALGLGHPDGCTEETMYAFTSFGETKKRTLGTGDIAGMNNLY